MLNIPVIALIAIFSATIILHVLVVLRLIPYSFIWGGRLKSDRQMYVFEAFSIILNAVFLILMMTLAGWLNFPVSAQFIKVLLWIMMILFALNSVGNLFSKTKLERVVFTPVTIIITIFLAYIIFVVN